MGLASTSGFLNLVMMPADTGDGVDTAVSTLVDEHPNLRKLAKFSAAIKQEQIFLFPEASAINGLFLYQLGLSPDAKLRDFRKRNFPQAAHNTTPSW